MGFLLRIHVNHGTQAHLPGTPSRHGRNVQVAVAPPGDSADDACPAEGAWRHPGEARIFIKGGHGLGQDGIAGGAQLDEPPLALEGVLPGERRPERQEHCGRHEKQHCQGQQEGEATVRRASHHCLDHPAPRGAARIHHTAF